jgi:plasmid maintenance system antidote protein VapI
MSENGVKTIKDFAAEIEVHRMTVSDIVRKHALPTQRMTHGQAIGLPPSTQLAVMQILGMDDAIVTAAAAAS